VDTQGRLFGRWNAIDALVGVVLLLLIPLLVGGYLLFRPSEPVLTSIEPARVTEGSTPELTVRGANLRPYMRVYFNEHQGSAFLFADATKVVVPIGKLPPGKYDVVLYDQTHERARLAQAFEVAPAARAETQLDLIGSFTGVAEASVQHLKEGMAIPGLGQVLRLAKPSASVTRTAVAPGGILNVPSRGAFNIDAVIRADCTLAHRGNGVTCTALDTTLMEDSTLQAVVSGTSMLFQIDQVRVPAESSVVTVRARFGGDLLVLDRMRAGDRDARRGNQFAAAGTIASLEATRGANTSIAFAAPTASGRIEPFVLSDLGVRDVVLRLPAEQVGDSWSYAGRALAAGALIEFHTPNYELKGTVLSVTPGQ
jgi:hypothetical protein